MAGQRRGEGPGVGPRRGAGGTRSMGDGNRARGIHGRAPAPEDAMTRFATAVLCVASLAGACLFAAPARAQTPAAPAAPPAQPGARPAARAAAPAARPAPRPGEVESDPIRCWWKTDRTSIRVGESFALTLTCGVIETGPIAVVPALTQLEGGAIQLTPFEVVSATRRADVVVPPWRYAQFEYTVRLLNDGFFGQD